MSAALMASGFAWASAEVRGVWTSLAMAFGCACSCPAQRGDSVGEVILWVAEPSAWWRTTLASMPGGGGR